MRAPACAAFSLKLNPLLTGASAVLRTMIANPPVVTFVAADLFVF